MLTGTTTFTLKLIPKKTKKNSRNLLKTIQGAAKDFWQPFMFEIPGDKRYTGKNSFSKLSILNFGCMDESFGKNEKLKSKELIETLFREGRSVKKFPFTLIYLPLSNKNEVSHKVGISVPRKLVKKAVHRNRIKRLMREAFRKNKYLVTANISTYYAFMIIYTSREEPTYEKLQDSLQLLLKKFRNTINEPLELDVDGKIIEDEKD